MRPDIADLVVGSIYEELLNHDSVKMHPDVMGVTKNVFFITHTEQESSVSFTFYIIQYFMREVNCHFVPTYVINRIAIR